MGPNSDPRVGVDNSGKAKLDGIAVALPTANVSLVDLTAEVEREAAEITLKATMSSAEANGLAEAAQRHFYR